MLRIDNESRCTEAIKKREDCEQPHETRYYAGKAHGVELAQAQLIQASPALERPTGDQKSGNYKKDPYSVISAPEKNMVSCRREQMSDRRILQTNTKVDVVQDYSKNAKATKNIDARDTPFRIVD